MAHGILLRFPIAMVRRRARRPADVFAPLRDAARLERAHSKLIWGCAAVTTALAVVLQLTVS